MLLCYVGVTKQYTW